MLSHVARGDAREHENPRGLVRERTGTTVHDGRAGILHPARLGTVEPGPRRTRLASNKSIASIFKRGCTVHDELFGRG